MCGDGGTGGRVVQGVRFLPLAADAGGEGVQRGGVVFGGGNARVQGVQHRAVGILTHALRQGVRLCGGTVENGGNGRGVGIVAERGAELRGDGGTGGRVVQAVCFLPLCADGGSECFLRGRVALGGGDVRAQGVQDVAVGFLFDALRQKACLCGGAFEDGADRRGVAVVAQGGGELRGDGGAGGRVVQGVFFAPARADGGGEAFLCGGVVTRSADAVVQVLQHFAIGGLAYILRQLRGLCRGAVKDGGKRRFVNGTVQGGADLPRKGGTGGTVLQGMRVLPHRAEGGGEDFLRGVVAAGGADTAAQGLQDGTVAVLRHAPWQGGGLRGGAVEDGGDGIGIGDAVQRGRQLLRHGGAGGAVLQAVRFLPLCADSGGEHFLLDGIAVDFAETHAVQHAAIGVLAHALRQFCRLAGGAGEEKRRMYQIGG